MDMCVLGKLNFGKLSQKASPCFVIWPLLRGKRRKNRRIQNFSPTRRRQREVLPHAGREVKVRSKHKPKAGGVCFGILDLCVYPPLRPRHLPHRDVKIVSSRETNLLHTLLISFITCRVQPHNSSWDLFPKADIPSNKVILLCQAKDPSSIRVNLAIGKTRRVEPNILLGKLV